MPVTQRGGQHPGAILRVPTCCFNKAQISELSLGHMAGVVPLSCGAPPPGLQLCVGSHCTLSGLHGWPKGSVLAGLYHAYLKWKALSADITCARVTSLLTEASQGLEGLEGKQEGKFVTLRPSRTH